MSEEVQQKDKKLIPAENRLRKLELRTLGDLIQMLKIMNNMDKCN